MNSRYKDLTLKLSDLLQKESLQFMMKNLEKKEETKHILDLVISSHFSSCFSLMKLISDDHEPMKKTVKDFIEKVESFLQTTYPIRGIERIGSL